MRGGGRGVGGRGGSGRVGRWGGGGGSEVRRGVRDGEEWGEVGGWEG